MAATRQEVVERQPRVVELGAKFTPAARERIDTYLQSFVSFEPVLALLYSDVGGEGSWSLAAFGQATVDDMASMYSRFGAVIWYDIDGIRLVVPQLAHIDKLDSGTLDLANGRIVRRAAEGG